PDAAQKSFLPRAARAEPSHRSSSPHLSQQRCAGAMRTEPVNGQFHRLTEESPPAQAVVRLIQSRFLAFNRGTRAMRWAFLGTAVAIGVSAPVQAQDSDVAPTVAVKPAVAVAPMPAADSHVAPFYFPHPGTLVWLRDEGTRAAAAKLVPILKRAPIDGL